MLFEVAGVLLKKLCKVLIFRIMRYFGCHWEKQPHCVQQFACLLLIKLVTLASHGPNDIGTQGQFFDLRDTEMLAVHQIDVPLDAVAGCFHQTIRQVLSSFIL